MAWWRTGEGNDICGDAPADILDAWLNKLLQRGAGTSPIGLPELLRLWQDALNSKVAGLLSDADTVTYSISAWAAPDGEPMQPPQRIEADVAVSDVILRAEALGALSDVAQAYRDAVDRLPRVNEMRRCLQFVIGYPAQQGLLREGPLIVNRLEILAAATATDE